MAFFKKAFYFVLALPFVIQTLVAQQKVTINPPAHIQSIVLKPLKVNTYAPIIRLGDSFILEFDDLESDQKRYSYKIEHYDFNWENSNLNATEFLNGFNSDLIRDYENSFNTLQDYTHYKVQLPNDNIQLKISGNYLISVLDESDVVIFTRPFIVYQPSVTVGVTTHRSRDIASLNTKQNIQFTINHPNVLINNPSLEIKTAIYQNNDWNTVIKNTKPQFIQGSQLLYKYNAKLFFEAGNEYLYFDTKEIRNATNNIARTELKDIFNTYLYTDEERLHRGYSYNPDVNGNFVLRTIDTDDINTEGDYSWVHFSLESFEDIGTKPIYIYGDFNGWQLTEANQMRYDSSTKLYHGKLLLKQGFYNYTYVIQNEDGTINKSAIEGSFYQTENQYTVLVYYRPYGTRFDQVIGVGNANSENLRN
tara:strand:+ start:81299 stop:82558 length:1260 start_codon:yes stop_codon:yes gene_type:complete